MKKYAAWGLVALLFSALAHWHGVAPGAKEVRVTGQSAWNTVLSKRDRAVFNAKVVRVVSDPFEHKTKIDLEADDGSPITVYQSPMISGIHWPEYGQRVEVKAQQLGPGIFTLVDHDSVRWNAPRVNDEKLEMYMYGYPKLGELLANGVRRIEIRYEGIVVAVGLVPGELTPKLYQVVRENRPCRFDGYEQVDITWITAIHD